MRAGAAPLLTSLDAITHEATKLLNLLDRHRCRQWECKN